MQERELTTAPTTTSTWTIDPVHTSVGFAVSHLGISTYRGRFRTVEGRIELDEADPARSSVTASIDAASIDTVNDRLHGHLLSPEFLEVEKYPKLTFRSTRVERVDDTAWKVYGDLTIRDVTNEVVLHTRYLGQETHPFSHKRVAAFSAETSFNRKEFGLRWDAALLNGGAYLGEQVRITLEIEAVREE